MKKEKLSELLEIFKMTSPRKLSKEEAAMHRKAVSSFFKKEETYEEKRNRLASEHEYGERCANDNSAYFSASNSYRKGYDAGYAEAKEQFTNVKEQTLK